MIIRGFWLGQIDLIFSATPIAVVDEVVTHGFLLSIFRVSQASWSWAYEDVQCVCLIRQHLNDIKDVKNNADSTTEHEIDVIVTRVSRRKLYNRTTALQCLWYNYSSIRKKFPHQWGMGMC